MCCVMQKPQFATMASLHSTILRRGVIGSSRASRLKMKRLKRHLLRLGISPSARSCGVKRKSRKWKLTCNRASESANLSYNIQRQPSVSSCSKGAKYAPTDERHPVRPATDAFSEG